MWIRTTLLLITVAACGVGCKYDDVELLGDGGGTCTKCPALPDLAPPPLKCSAAKGLSGDNLICVNFASIADQPLGASPPAPLTGWDFVSNCGGMNWGISSGKLQITSFDQFASTCGFMMPTVNLNDADKQKYNSVTLSVLQRVDIVPSQQTAQASLGSPLPTRTFWSSTGKTEHQQLMISMSRSDPVPTAANGMYQYLFQLISGVKAGGTAQGWQIESIAVNASQ